MREAIRANSRRGRRRAFERLEVLRTRGMVAADDPTIGTIINAPAVLAFDFSTADAEIARAFFGQLRSTLEDRRPKRLMVELASVRVLSLGAAVVLVAEFDRWQRVTHSRLQLRTVEKWDPQVVQQLKALGFFRLLGTRLPPRLKWARNPEWIRFMSGTETVGAAAKELRVRLEDHLGESSGVASEIYIALVESMKNALQHAYPDGDTSTVNEHVGKRWWMAGTVERQSRHIRVAFFDAGITIPKSLPRSWLWKELTENARGGGDHLMIMEALQYGISRLGQPHRGKGFSNIQYPTLLRDGNVVSVMSGSGHCLNVGRALLGAPLDNRLNGTLIEWDFLLDDEVENVEGA